MASRKPKKASWSLQKSSGAEVARSQDIDAHHLVFTASNGAVTRVELYERNGYGPGLRISTLEGILLVEPEASNTVRIINDTHVAREIRRKKKHGDRW